MTILRLRSIALLPALAAVPLMAAPAEFQSSWSETVDRVWVGPEYWADRLQDWRIRGGRLECVEASEQKPVRVVHLLTAAAGSHQGELQMSVHTGPVGPAARSGPDTWTGFLIGSGGDHVDYRLTALAHQRPAEDGGLIAGFDGRGQVVFRDFSARSRDTGIWGMGGAVDLAEMPELPPVEATHNPVPEGQWDDLLLRLELRPGTGGYRLTLSAHVSRSGELISRASLDGLSEEEVHGGLGLVSHLAPAGGGSGYWFRSWKLSGSKLVEHPERAFGPVLTAQHTLSLGVLKMTAQMPPLGQQDPQEAELQIRRQDGSWQSAARSRLVQDSYTFPFRVDNWDGSRETEYRVLYPAPGEGQDTEPSVYSGTLRREPVDKDEIVVAAFTGHKIFTGGLKWNSNGIWFPHNELVAAVQYHRPDFLFFSGDQVYEGDLTGAQYEPLDKAILDYLDKWYRWCWAFRDLTRDAPSVAIPDDHDVYHGNIWGAGGKATQGQGQAGQDSGGYKMSPRFVNMVQRTQTSHLPDPYDPTPVEQGIGVYYTEIRYGGISFAVIEDRKWKSSPAVMLPKGQCVNGWFQNPDFDPVKEADLPEAILLGRRQLEFLNDWASDWSTGTWMKVVLSQTLFANIATLPRDATSDGVVPALDYFPPGVYPKTDKRVADADSNGWPQSGRNRALREIRRGFGFHIAGDQHLGSFVHYGVEDWEDAGFALCVPSVGNTWPRRWYPPEEGMNRQPDSPPYTGRFRDGFGNRITVHAVSNPVISGREPAGLYDRAPGYGIVRFNRETRRIVVECWPRWVDPSQAGARQYLGWPVTINQLDNYAQNATLFLPTLKIEGLIDPVVQVIEESSNELVYTIRINGRTFQPRVLSPGEYTVRIGEPGTQKMKVLGGLTAVEDHQEEVVVEF